jgi:hypothetical protein
MFNSWTARASNHSHCFSSFYTNTAGIDRLLAFDRIDSCFLVNPLRRFFVRGFGGHADLFPGQKKAHLPDVTVFSFVQSHADSCYYDNDASHTHLNSLA